MRLLTDVLSHATKGDNAVASSFAMKRKRINVDHPLWEKLRALDKVAAQRFPYDFDEGFGRLGLILCPRLSHGGYFCTPDNTLMFARTGGEGVHFSFVVHDQQVTEKSPIVVTIPGEFGSPNFIVGESLFDFLCLGYYRGFFALETVAGERWFEPYSSADWQPSKDSDYAVGYVLDDHQQRVLSFLIEELGLKPWKDLKRRFQRLQQLYMHLLQVPDEDTWLK
jgi:hypothetical protein